MGNEKMYFLRRCALLAPLALAACTPVKKDDGATVEARAAARWDLLIKHQAEKAYDYLTPGFRQTITREKYAAQKNDVATRWKGAHVSGRACEGDSCTVTVMVDADVKIPGIGKLQSTTMPTEERWVRVGRDWFYLPDTRLKAVPIKGEEDKPAAPPAGGGTPPGN